MLSPGGAKEHGWNSQPLERLLLRPFRACPYWGGFPGFRLAAPPWAEFLRRFAALIILGHGRARRPAPTTPNRRTRRSAPARTSSVVPLCSPFSKKASSDKPAACCAPAQGSLRRITVENHCAAGETTSAAGLPADSDGLAFFSNSAFANSASRLRASLDCLPPGSSSRYFW